ncbi:MAG: hypothetical protein QOI81_687 [Actinomycetota bacterium]|nr:hypothetical protein [Actinomycetota bacterium]
MLARIPADVSKRIILGICVAALAGAACSTLPVATVSYGSGTEFIPMVADNLDNVGMGNAVAMDKDGVPYISYFGFTEKLKKGAIPIPRPLLTPGVPSVLISSEKNNIWTHGAAAVAVPSVTGIVWPYAPAVDTHLKNILATNTNGTDIAIGADGVPHTVWTGPDGIWETDGGTAGLASVATHVLTVDPPLSEAGEIGRPSIALDAAGTPWVAFTSTASGTGEVDVATPGNKGWDVTTVATLKGCNGCPAGNTQLLLTSNGMEVAYADPSVGVMLATQPAAGSAATTTTPTTTWSTEKVAAKVAGIGLDATVAKDGTVLLSYYTGNGTVELTTGAPGAWSTKKVADVVDPDPQAVGNATWTTGVAADDSGAVSVTWYDKGSDSVKLASGASASALAPVDTPGTLGGTEPALGVSPDGSNTYLSWYDVSTTSLLVGVLGSAKGVEIAAPSPTPTALAQTATVCSPTGTNLSITALNTAFDKSCLAAPADKAFKIVFDNQDPFNHNVAIYDSSNKVLFTGPLTASPTTYHVGGLPAGTYKFQCDVHPTVMNGIFIVAK